MPSRATTYWYDTEANDGNSYGTQVIGSGNILCRVEVRGAIAFPIGSLTADGAGFSLDTMHGLQLLINDSSLLTLPADITDSRWLTVEAHVPTEVVAVWAPSSDTAGSAVGGPIRLSWAGQMPLTDDMELAYTTGTLGAATDGWFMYGTMQVWVA